MATIELTHKRVGNDIGIALKLLDSGVAIDWTTVDRVYATLFSDQQRVRLGMCKVVGPDEQDPTILRLLYSGKSPQYLGLTRVVVEVTYHGHVSTFDKPVLVFVASTAEEGTFPVAVEISASLDPEENNLEIAVSDVDTSVLDAAIQAANDAAERANEAAQHGPYINPQTHTWMVWDATSGQYVDTEVDAGGDGHSPYIGENGHWWEWDIVTGDFVDSGVAAQGPAGQNGTNGTNGTDGTDGHSPYIGNNGHWFVYDDSTQQYVDTDVNAQGPAGQNGTNGTNGTDGHSPYIGVNGNWYVWDTQSSQFVDSGVSAGADLTDYTDQELQTAIDTAFANL